MHAFFQTHASATYAASGCQHWFDAPTPQTGRIYYKLNKTGTFPYSLLFSNTIDSTFADGSVSYANLHGGQWELLSVSMGIVKTCSAVDAAEPAEWVSVGENITVQPTAVFHTEEAVLTGDKDDYLCLEITCCGKGIPCHPESVLPVFVKTDNGWVRSTNVPFPSCIGCVRDTAAHLALWGDSITQGCGTAVNSYTHWGAHISEMLGDSYSVWNIGLGYGRAMDAASLGIWMEKAAQMDGVAVCFGVNDILRQRTAQQVKTDLTTIVDTLHRKGVRVLLQTVPPFDYSGDTLTTWREVNRYIRDELSGKADAFFDCVPVLSDSGDKDDPNAKKYGGHPNAAGGLAWATALFPVMKDFAETTAEMVRAKK